MIKVAIVEDEELYARELAGYLKRYQSETGETLEIVSYRDGDGITACYDAQFDIILMDIQMKFVDGMTAAEEIRKVDSEVVIIFITSMSQYAIRGYEVGALDYILKPISYFMFSQKFGRAIDKIKKRERKYITIPIKSGIMRLDIADIRYIESLSHNLIFHTGNECYATALTMKSMEEKLKNLGFSRGNNCYLINLEHVEGIRDKCAVMKGGERLQISRQKMNSFMKDLTKYWNER